MQPVTSPLKPFVNSIWFFCSIPIEAIIGVFSIFVLSCQCLVRYDKKRINRFFLKICSVSLISTQIGKMSRYGCVCFISTKSGVPFLE